MILAYKLTMLINETPVKILKRLVGAVVHYYMNTEYLYVSGSGVSGVSIAGPLK